MLEIGEVLQDDRFQALPQEERHKVIDTMLSKDDKFAALSPDEQFKARSALYLKQHQAKEDLPTEIAGVKVPPQVSAAVVGLGHGAQWAEQGIAQLTGVDVDKPRISSTPFDDLALMVRDGIVGKDRDSVKAAATAAEEGFKKLEKDKQVGGAATVGNIAGQVLSPTNLAVPGAIGATIPKMMSSGAAIGAATGAISPVGEGESRWENAKQGALYMAAGNLVLGTIFKAARSLKGREAIPPSGEIPVEVRENLKIANPGLNDETLDVLNERATGMLNAQDRAMKTAQKYPDADASWLENKSKKIPADFRQAAKDPQTAEFMKQAMQKRSDMKAAITDDHEMYQFLEREANSAAQIRDMEAAQWAEARARENPLTPEPLTPEAKAEAVLQDRAARQQRALTGEQLRGEPPKTPADKKRLAEGVVIGGEATKPARERTLAEVAEDARAKPAFMQDASDRLAIAAQRKPLYRGQQGFISQNLMKTMASSGVGSAAGGYVGNLMDEAEGDFGGKKNHNYAYTFAAIGALLGGGARTAVRELSQTWRQLGNEAAYQATLPARREFMNSIQRLESAIGKEEAAKFVVNIGDHVEGKGWEHLTQAVNKKIEQSAWVSAGKKIGEKPAPIWIPPNQSGRISPALLNRMAAAGVGSAAGAYLDPDNPLQGAIFGALAGLGAYQAGSMLVKGNKWLKEKVFVEDGRVRIDHFADARDGEIAAWQRETMQRQRKMENLVKPNLDRDKALYLSATGETKVPMTKAEAEYVRLARANMDELGKMGLDAGTLDSLRQDYITRLVDFGPMKSRSEILNLIKQVGQKGGGGSTATKTRFNKERVFDSLRDLEAAGYKLKTHNLSEIIGTYNHSVISAIENKKMIESIKAAVAPNGDRLIIPTAGLRSMPKGYETINHPQLFGQAVHSDIAPSMRFLFDRQDPSTVGAAIQAMSTAIKRGDVSFSLFHAMSLGQAYVGAIGGPKGLADILKAPFGKGGMEKMVQAFRTGGKGDIVDFGLRSGLRVGSATEDVNRTLLTAALRDVGQVLDKVIPLRAGEHAAIGIEKINSLVDNITWGHAHTGMKLSVFADKVERLMQNNIKAHEKNPLIPLMKKEEAGVIAAKFANTIFGGLDYRRLAEGIKNKYGRDLALWALAPKQRRVAQILMFAPDWTLSTLQSMTGALGKGSKFGVINPRTLADLHRQYLARSAFYFAVIGDGLNYAYSGHHLWENKDPTRVDLGDGRTLQLSKHFTEPIHDILHPDQASLNKMGVLPKQFFEQAMNKQYLSTGGAPSITKPGDTFLEAAGKRLGHLAGSPIPIPIQQGMKQGLEAGVLSTLGVPIYGRTTKEIEESKKQAALTRYKNSMDPKKIAEKEAKKREKERQKRIAEGGR